MKTDHWLRDLADGRLADMVTEAQQRYQMLAGEEQRRRHQCRAARVKYEDRPAGQLAVALADLVSETAADPSIHRYDDQYLEISVLIDIINGQRASIDADAAADDAAADDRDLAEDRPEVIRQQMPCVLPPGSYEWRTTVITEASHPDRPIFSTSDRPAADFDPRAPELLCWCGRRRGESIDPVRAAELRCRCYQPAPADGGDV